MKRLILVIIILNLVAVNILLSKWTLARDPGVFENIHGLKFLNKDTGFAAGWSIHSMIMKTTNGGENWQIHDSLPYQVFSINTLDGVKIFAAGASLINECGLFLFSTDKGESWIPYFFNGKDKPFSYGFYNIEILNSQTYIMSGYNGVIVKSKNAGIDWDTVHTGVNNEVFAVMDFVDESIGYAASGPRYEFDNINKIYKTTDGGENWFLLKERDSLIKIGTLKFWNADIGYLFGMYRKKATIMKTTDGGVNWTTIFTGKDNIVLLAADFINESTILTAGQTGYVYKTTDAGQSWVQELTGTSEDYLSVDCIDEDFGYIAGTKGLIMKYDLSLIAEDNNEIYSDILLYPNPVSETGYLNLENIKFNSYEIKIYDVTGNTRLTRTGINNQSTEISFNQLEPGIYFYNLILDNQTIITGKIIKL